jgi:hypothetical protein
MIHYVILDERETEVSRGATPYLAWKKLYEDLNTFADNMTEFRTIMVGRGYRVKRRAK